MEINNLQYCSLQLNITGKIKNTKYKHIYTVVQM